MELPNRPQENNPDSERKKMAAHEVNNLPKMNAGTTSPRPLNLSTPFLRVLDEDRYGEENSQTIRNRPEAASG